MRLFALAVTLSLVNFTIASAQTPTPDNENGRYSFSSVADGVLRLDTRTGQVSQCSRSDAGWVCKAVPDERSALETEIARLQGEKRHAEEGAFGPWATGTWCVQSIRCKAQRAGAQAAERCRGRQGDFVP
jgi:hypothetical protein